MSFNKAESTAATSGYWRWVGDVEEMRRQRASYVPKFRMTGDEAGVARLDHDWLLAQARAMNDEAPSRGGEGLASGGGGGGDARAEPPGYALCADIIERQETAKRDARARKEERRERRRAEHAEAARKSVMSNLRRATHSAPFMPTKSKRPARPFVDAGAYGGGMAGVDEYNATKRGFYHSMDNNHHDVIHQLLDHENKHVDRVDHLTVNHPSLPASTVPDG